MSFGLPSSAPELEVALRAALQAAGVQVVPVPYGTVRFPTFVVGIDFFAAARDAGVIRRHHCGSCSRDGRWAGFLPEGSFPVIVDGRVAGDVVRVELRTTTFSL